jgi:hypothetical protein
MSCVKSLHVINGDFIVFFRRTGNATMLHEAADVLACDAHIDQGNVDTGLIAGFLDGLFDSVNGLIDVENNTLHNAFRLGFAHAEHFELAELVLATHDRTDLCSAYVETDYDFLVFHDAYSL